ncbi:MAG TPA: hypothetical protein VM682_05375, partial [Bacillus sp. (in: firmicutes)]|nr:hypothetical protein [Bacillus sp. (in: firmicutes)]
KDVSCILCTIISAAKELFYKHVWLFRCEEFAVFEKSEGITQQQKRDSFKSSPAASLLNSTSLSFARQISAESKWKSWITQSLNTGHLWSGFPIHINSLIQ